MRYYLKRDVVPLPSATKFSSKCSRTVVCSYLVTTDKLLYHVMLSETRIRRSPAPYPAFIKPCGAFSFTKLQTNFQTDIDRNGITRTNPNTTLGQTLVLETPAPVVGRQTLNFLAGPDDSLFRSKQSNPYLNVHSIQRTEADIARRRQLVERFYQLEKQRLGSVPLASGFARRSPGNHRLDWALVRTDETKRALILNKVSIFPFIVSLGSS